MERVFEVIYAGTPVRYQFRYNRTARFFGRHIHLSECNAYDIRMNDNEFDLFRKVHPEDISDYYVEYKGLIYLTSKKLLSNRCCIFHAASFYWKGKAWLLTGNSGVGKTTQYMNWNTVYPNEIAMISGDMPLLDFTGDHILVRPSPWNGKENLQGSISSELGGVIILKQDDNNTIEHAGVKDAILNLFKQFSVIPEKEEEIISIAEMTQRIMREVPVWILANDGSEDSTRLLRDTILDYLEKEDQT